MKTKDRCGYCEGCNQYYKQRAAYMAAVSEAGGFYTIKSKDELAKVNALAASWNARKRDR